MEDERYAGQGLFYGAAVSVLSFFALSVLFVDTQYAHASVADWHKGGSVVPMSATDFSSEAFKQSARDFKDMGGNTINFIIPYYQSNAYSTDIGPGWNTPSDESLAEGIRYVRSLGLKAGISIYLDTYSREWRAYINPQGGERPVWYQRYGDVLVRYGRLAEQNGVELFQLGAEMTNVSSGTFAASNTDRWNTMIANVRAVYSGKLTYSANRPQQDEWSSEASNIGFWDKLDYVGISTYYGFGGSDSVENIKDGWSYNDANFVSQLQRFGKPILFTEIGYRSLDGARFAPWDHFSGGSYDPQEQSNLYEALFQYWNERPYMNGIGIWWWSVDSNYGGPGNTDYTPQNKPAEDVIKRWWTGTNQPPPSDSVSFTTQGGAHPTNPEVGQGTSFSASVTNSSNNPVPGIVVDLEIYRDETRVFQRYFENESFSAGQTRNFDTNWTPDAEGEYVVKIGVFSSAWSQNYAWNDSAATIRVGSSGNPTPPPPSSAVTTEVWWPSDGVRVNGLQPFKAVLQNKDVSQYSMFWQVDGGGFVEMETNMTDWPHKEALVELSNWNWNGAGPYNVNFVSKDNAGNVMSQKSVQIWSQ